MEKEILVNNVDTSKMSLEELKKLQADLRRALFDVNYQIDMRMLHGHKCNS